MKKIFLNKGSIAAYIIILSTFMLASIIMLVISLRPVTYEENNVSAHGRHDLDFRIFYFENNIFDYNPIPRNLTFLMSYTDYIEIESTFFTILSEDTDIYFNYYSYKRFVIRHMASSDANLSPIVFEETFYLSEIDGRFNSNQVHFDSSNNGFPGGIYTITPRTHIDAYFEFIADVNRQIAEQGIFPQGPRGFSAELWINFTYSVEAPELDFSETSTRGYRLPLTTEVYSLTLTGGNQSFQWQTNLAINEEELSTFLIGALALAFVTSFIGTLYCLKLLKRDSNVMQNEANIILSKYSKEIVMYTAPADKSKFRNVREFADLLKLAIASDRLITCYRDEDFAQFSVSIDGISSIYEIKFTDATTEINTPEDNPKTLIS